MDFWALTSDIENSQNCIKSCILKTLQVFGPFVEKGRQSSTVECVWEKNRVTR